MRGCVEVLRALPRDRRHPQRAARRACWPSGRPPSSASTRPTSTSAWKTQLQARPASRPCTSSARRSGPGAAGASRRSQRAVSHMLRDLPVRAGDLPQGRHRGDLRRPSAGRRDSAASPTWRRRAPRSACRETRRSSRCCRAAAGRRSSTMRAPFVGAARAAAAARPGAALRRADGRRAPARVFYGAGCAKARPAATCRSSCSTAGRTTRSRPPTPCWSAAARRRWRRRCSSGRW